MFKRPTRSLVGNTKKEKTRDELLAEIKAQRAARGESKQRGAAAATIQAVWHGWRCRCNVHAHVQQQLLQQVAPLVLEPQKAIDAAWIASWMLPRLLFLLPIQPNAAYSLQFAPSSAASTAAAATASATSQQLVKCVRACLAVLVRSLTATDASQSYLAYGLQQLDASAQGTAGSSWTVQASRLLRVCAAIVCAPTHAHLTQPVTPLLGSAQSARAQSGQLSSAACVTPGTSDPLLDAAAVRLILLLCDSTLWKCEAQTAAKEQLVQQLCTHIAAHPVPLFAASARALHAATAGGNGPEDTSLSSQSTATSGSSSVPAVAGSRLATPTGAAAGHASKLMAVVLRVLEQAAGSSSSNTITSDIGTAGGTTLEPAWRAFADLIMPAPALMLSLTNDARAQLSSKRMLQLLSTTLQQAVTTTPTQGFNNNAKPPHISSWLQAAANLTLLSFGALPATRTGAACVVRDVGHLKTAEQASLYCQTVSMLLVRSCQMDSSNLDQAELAACSSACVQGLWPLVQRPAVLGLLAAMEQLPDGIPVLCAMWAEAMELFQLLAKQLSGAQLPTGGIPNLLSSLAFTPGVLPILWRWLAKHVGLPLDAPKEASRGLSVSSLRAGYQGLSAMHALVLGMFCRLYQHLLQVIYDEEFHANAAGLGGGLSIAQSRAVVTSLNTLVYHTYLPAKAAQPISLPSGQPPQSAAGPQASSSAVNVSKLISFPADSLLSMYAPLLLRSLYERDTRRPFCQPQLWIAPYQSMFGDVDAAVAAHNSALLRAGDDAVAAALARTRSGQQRRNSSSGEEESGRGTGSFLRNLFSSSSSRRSATSAQQSQQLQQQQPIAPLAGPSHPGPSSTAAQAGNEFERVMSGLMSWAAGGHDMSDSTANNHVDPRAAFVGPFRASRIVACFLSGEQDDGGDDAMEDELQGAPGLPALKVRAAEGARPESLASLLRTAPQAIPFERRVDLFRALLAEDKARGGFDRPVFEGGTAPIKVTIRRAQMMDDAYRALAGMGRGLRARLVITFINEQGLSEAGLDYGGLMKEFLEEVVVRGFNADAGLWATSPDTGQVYPRPSAHRMESGIQMLQFLGLMVGKALYEGILLNVAFAPFFVTRLQGRTPMLDDLQTLDPALYKSLMQVKQYEGDVSELGLTFTVEDDFFGQTTQHALLPGQANLPVTNDNRLLYCHLLADWHLNVRLGRAADAFSRGMAACIPPASLRLFSPQEFNQLVSGGGDEGGALDVQDMRRHTRYSGGYRADSTTVKLLWQVISEFNAEQRGRLLRFCTSCSRAPLGGFRYLQPPLTIHKVDCDASVLAMVGGKDVDRLPSASTCYNMLKLPNYRRKETLRTKLLYAINSGAGFELS